MLISIDIVPAPSCSHQEQRSARRTMPPYNFFADGSNSKHKYYYCSRSPSTSSSSSSSSPPPRRTPPMPPQPRRPRAPCRDAGLSHPASWSGARLEERVPSSECVYSYFRHDLVADPFKSLSGKWRIDWFDRATEQARRRASVSSEADRTHRELLDDIVRNYEEAHDKACSEAYVRGAQDTMQQMQQDWNRRGVSTSATEPETDDICLCLASRRLAKASKSRDQKGGKKKVRIEVKSGFGSVTGPWQRSTSRQPAENKALLKSLEKIWGARTQEMEIRLRGGCGGQKAWVRQKTGGEEKSERKPSRFPGDYGGVNDVEWQDSWSVYENGAKKERRVRLV
jgi:hypothetical protein